MVACPVCGSRHLRYSRLVNFNERLGSLVGVRPLRCRDCRTRFIDRTWRLANIRYARCPRCWRMDLNLWSRRDYRVRVWQAFMLQLGARPYRCEYCRCNFVSFRPRKEKFTFRRWKKGGPAAPVPTTSGDTPPRESAPLEE